MEISHLVIVFIICLCQTFAQVQEPRTFTIGAVLSSDDKGQEFQRAILRANNEPMILNSNVRFNSTYILMDDNPIR